jgi:hypothetical protein
MQADDINVGDLITITAHKPRMVQVGGFMDTRIQSMPRTEWIGEPLRVAAVQLPFLATQRKGGYPLSIDLRESDVQRVTTEYAEAMGFTTEPTP